MCAGEKGEVIKRKECLQAACPGERASREEGESEDDITHGNAAIPAAAPLNYLGGGEPEQMPAGAVQKSAAASSSCNILSVSGATAVVA